jgi:hypothetical protein
MKLVKRKSGFLLGEETIKIVIALICIVFLVYLLVSLYASKINNEKKRQAEALLKESDSASLKLVIERVRTGQGVDGGNSEEKLVHNPKGWLIISYSGNGIKPNSCLHKNCLCVCPGTSNFDFSALTNSEEERQASECDDGGSCLVVEDLANSPDIKITVATDIVVQYQGGIFVRENGP